MIVAGYRVHNGQIALYGVRRTLTSVALQVTPKDGMRSIVSVTMRRIRSMISRT